MTRILVVRLLVFYFTCFSYSTSVAQVKEADTDTFFLAKNKGIIGRLAKTITTSPQPEPVKIANPYIKYKGRTIRFINVFPLGINQSFDDTATVKLNFLGRLGNALHKTSLTEVIRKQLFFHEGDKFLPFMISDNETFLRNQSFLRDALIVVFEAPADSVDIVVLSRDVFSIGGSVNVNTKRARSEVRDENILGTGNQVSISGILDKERHPSTGVGGELIIRNIGGTFMNWTTGFSTFASAISSNRDEEKRYYSRLEKPLVSRYSRWTAAIEFSYNSTSNNYIDDSLYKSNIQYTYTNFDFWGGYNIGARAKIGEESEKRLRHFVAARTFYTYFDRLPGMYDSSYNSNYANLYGALFSYTLFKQNYYRTNFIYGFGRNEDVPIGLSASLIAGWTKKQDQRRPYYGIEFEGTNFSKKSIFSSYKLRIGGYSGKGGLEDIDLLAGVDHFTKLRKLSDQWLNRNFISFAFTKQFNSLLNEPLFLRSEFGLPYFQNGSIAADERITLKAESVFYNLRNILGFRFAPFVFGDLSFLKPLKEKFGKSDGYSAIGGGIRTRNESLVFGTIELRVYYFPRTVDGMKNWKVDVISKLRFKFNSSFIRKPSFIIAN